MSDIQHITTLIKMLKTELPSLSESPASGSQKVYYSNAKWTKIPDSQDSHQSFEHANAVCMLLREDYGSYKRPCEIRGYCLDSWVTDENGNRIK